MAVVFDFLRAIYIKILIPDKEWDLLGHILVPNWGVKVIVNADVGSYVVLLFYSHFCTPRRHQRSSESLRQKIMYNIVIAAP